MLLCPIDLGPCQRSDCAAGLCRVAAESPFRICASCGTLNIGSADGKCAACAYPSSPVPSVKVELN